MQERNNLIRQQESQSRRIQESVAGSSGEETPATSEDEVEAADTDTGEMSLLDILKSVPATQDMGFGDEVLSDNMHFQRKCKFLWYAP